jgi:hypothetical protein
MTNNIIEEIVRVNRTVDTRVELSGEINVSCDYQYEDERSFFKLDDNVKVESDIHEFIEERSLLEDNIFEEVKDRIYVDSVDIKDVVSEEEIVKVNDLDEYAIKDLLLRNPTYEIQENLNDTIKRKVFVKKYDSESESA